MRIALVIISIFLGAIAIELNAMPNLLPAILTGIAWLCLWNDYFEAKKKKK